ncbi:MAG: DUF2000 domain-containing protein [Oscillospiraceae bacterium]|nr:DUF2000 domain-containing protein [Oscillospiraceae bacterium]
METEDRKCVIILDGSLPVGILANTAAILGITLGSRIPEAVGPAVDDKSGNSHLGIITIPVPVLKASKEKIREIREKLFELEFSDVVTVDFSDVAQSCNIYSDYIKKAAAVQEKDFIYFGVGMYGRKNLINKLSGSLPLLR